MHVAYLSSRIYFPSPGLGQASIERDRFFPVFALACPPFLASSSRPLRTCNRAVGATRAQHGLHRYVSPPLSHPHTHTHTHTLSLSLSQRQWDNNHAHRPSSSPVRVLISGTSLGLFDLITLSNSRADSNSAIQHCTTSPLCDHRALSVALLMATMSSPPTDNADFVSYCTRHEPHRTSLTYYRGHYILGVN